MNKNFCPNLVLVPLFNVGLWTVLAVLTCPLAIVKSGISLVQLWAACENVVAIDVTERQQARRNKAD